MSECITTTRFGHGMAWHTQDVLLTLFTGNQQPEQNLSESLPVDTRRLFL